MTTENTETGLNLNSDAQLGGVSETKKPQKDRLGRSYGTGRRKTSVARVWVKPGSGKITINKQDVDEYFHRKLLKKIIQAPFEATGTSGQFDIVCTVTGGGTSGQAEAIRHGLARALDKFDPNLHKSLKSAKLLTRDARKVERKKYGRHKARKSTQFSKR
jgi:small subunit ribosomal protein S9